MFFDEFGHEQGNVVAALGKPRHVDAYLVQAEVQILSESPFLYCFLEVDIGGSDNTHIGAKDPIAAEAFELPLLDQTKQIALQFQRTLADLVQEDSAAANSNSPFRC